MSTSLFTIDDIKNALKRRGVALDLNETTFTINDIKNALKRNKWSKGVAWDLNETTTYEVFDYSQMTSSHKSTLQSASKIIDSKVVGANDTVLMNWNTALFTNNSDMRSIFGGSQNLTEWKSDLSSLTNGRMMFCDCSKLTTFTSDLSKMTSGDFMFGRCTSLTTFTSDLSSLRSGYHMFDGCTSLASFDSDLSSLTYGDTMFAGTALTSFNFDLSNLNDARLMFYNSALTSFNSDFSSLTKGYWTFWSCKLDADSLKNIIHTINDLSDDTDDGTTWWGIIYIGLGYTNTDASKLAIAKHCYCDTWEELKQEFSNKGWTAYFSFNGTESPSNVLNLLDDNETPSTIIWAKLEEVTDENKLYEYVLEEDPSKHYIIDWFHETNGSTEGYQQFGSLLEACGYFGVIPKEYVENQ